MQMTKPGGVLGEGAIACEQGDDIQGLLQGLVVQLV